MGIWVYGYVCYIQQCNAAQFLQQELERRRDSLNSKL